MSRLRRSYRAAALVWWNFCLLFVVANVIAALAVGEKKTGGMFNWYTQPPAFIVEALERSYPDLSVEERAALWLESSIPFDRDPLVLYREKAVKGRYINVGEHGFRVGKDQGPWPPADDAYNVFFFGGSTGFGYGVPDDQTIASFLQEILSTDDRSVRVYNFARGGYTSTMERALFEKLLLLGITADLAVFLDGVNDFGQAVDPAVLPRYFTKRTEEEIAHPWLAAFRSLPLVQALKPADWDLAQFAASRKQAEPPAPPDDTEVLDEVIHRYVANVQAIRAMGQAHGVKVFFVWQPAPVYKYDLQYHTYKQKSFGGHERSRHGFPRMRAHIEDHPLGDDFTWCADIQEGVEKLLYVDRMHYNPDMSERVARCIAVGAVAAGALD